MCTSPDDGPADENEGETEGGVLLDIVCDGCGALFVWRPGDEPEGELCPACAGLADEK